MLGPLVRKTLVPSVEALTARCAALETENSALIARLDEQRETVDTLVTGEKTSAEKINSLETRIAQSDGLVRILSDQNQSLTTSVAAITAQMSQLATRLERSEEGLALAAAERTDSQTCNTSQFELLTARIDSFVNNLPTRSGAQIVAVAAAEHLIESPPVMIPQEECDSAVFPVAQIQTAVETEREEKVEEIVETKDELEDVVLVGEEGEDVESQSSEGTVTDDGDGWMCGGFALSIDEAVFDLAEKSPTVVRNEFLKTFCLNSQTMYFCRCLT
jgi:uncharacterized coiled-coil protein SlyX